MNSFIKSPQAKNIFKVLFAVVLIAGVIVFAAGYSGAIRIPRELTIGPVSIRFYAVIIITGIALAAWLYERERKKHKQLANLVTDDGLIWAVIPGIIFARLWHFVAEWPLYEANPVSVLYIWQGGVSIHGALLGGVIGIAFYCRRKKIPLLPALELGFLFAPIAQIVGRFGNFINQELYGPPTNLPWGTYIAETGQYHHPAFLYEQIGNAILFAILFKIYKKRGLENNGRLIAIYLLGYSIVRFSVDLLRLDRKVLLGFTSPQLSAIITAALALGYLFYLARKVNGKKN